MACVDAAGELVSHMRLSEPLGLLYHWLQRWPAWEVGLVVLEKVGTMPHDGRGGAFTFGRSVGQLEGMLTAAGLTWEGYLPTQWQPAMGVPVGRRDGRTAHKNLLKLRAQGLFPGVRITHHIADALLLARFAWGVARARRAGEGRRREAL